MSSPSKLTHAHWAEIDLSSLGDLLKTPITQKQAVNLITEEEGFALAVLSSGAVGAAAEIMEWTKKLTENLLFEYVYVFKGSHQKIERYKIGKAKRIKDRRRIFAVKLPFDIELVAAFRVKNACKLEAEIHRSQAGNRVGGEWFNLDAESFDRVCRQGLCTELLDLSQALEERFAFEDSCDFMVDEEYISHLEGLLVMQGVSFSRSKNCVAGKKNGA